MFATNAALETTRRQFFFHRVKLISIFEQMSGNLRERVNDLCPA